MPRSFYFLYSERVLEPCTYCIISQLGFSTTTDLISGVFAHVLLLVELHNVPASLTMPLIEVLPNSTTTVAPGWAYVPDTGFDPSKAPIVPSGARKRTTRTAPVAARGALSATQQSKIAKYLVDLDKDSLRDVQIVVPNRPRDIAARGEHGTGTTP